jgi:hypothetical protein
MSKTERLSDVMEALARTRVKAQSSEEQELLSIALDAVLFIASTGQRYVFEDFREHLASNALPEVVAAFRAWKKITWQFASDVSHPPG